MRARACWIAIAIASVACKGNEKTTGSGSAPTPSTTVAPEAPPKGGKKGKGGKPNVIFVLSDDQRDDSVACMPRLQKMVGDKGVRFVNNFASTPLCCPGRSSVLTGLYAHNHKVLANGDMEDEDGDKTPGAIDFRKNGNEEKVFAKWLQAAGYRTGYFGKYLNGYERIVKEEGAYVPPHWDEWRAFDHAEYYDFELIEKSAGDKNAKRRCYLSDVSDSNGKKKEKKKEKKCRKGADDVIDDGKENYSTDILRDRVVDFIKKSHADKTPFFIHFAPKAPHGPFTSPKRYQPDPSEVKFTKLAMDRLEGCPLFDWKGRPASINEEDVSDKPEWIQNMKGTWGEAKLDKVRQQQLVSVLAIEDALEAITATLKSLGIDDETIIIYTADNGFAWGEHGYMRKNCAYEECARVPLLIFDPRAPQGGRKVEGMTMNIDLAPTIAALTNAKMPEKVDGKSMTGLLDGTEKSWPRTHVLTECWGLGGKGRPPVHAAVRTKKWKYIENYDDPARTKIHVRKDGDDDVELYDLEKDPFELENLARKKEGGLKKLGYESSAVDAMKKQLHGKLIDLEKE